MRQASRFEHVLSSDYVHAIGEVVVSWAFLEVDIDRAIHYMRYHPDAKALAATVPLSLKKRLRLFRDCVDAAFATYPAALPRLRQIGNDTADLAAKRHQLAHARWMAAREPMEFTGFLIRDGEWGNAVEIVTSKDKILGLARRINEVHLELDVLFGVGSLMNADHLLSPDEIAAMRAFRTDNCPTPPMPLLP